MLCFVGGRKEGESAGSEAARVEDGGGEETTVDVDVEAEVAPSERRGNERIGRFPLNSSGGGVGRGAVW